MTIEAIEVHFTHNNIPYCAVLRNDNKGGVVRDGVMVLMNANANHVFEYLKEINIPTDKMPNFPK
jgi:hypothetical protein